LTLHQDLIADKYFKPPVFNEIGFRSSYTININNLNTSIELFKEVKNVFDAYQTRIDIEKDSNFIYGSAIPVNNFLWDKIRKLETYFE
jgi:outer membrane receptor for ferrienterochelin and colicins